MVGGPLNARGFSCAGRRMHDDPGTSSLPLTCGSLTASAKAVLIENVRGFTMVTEPDASVRNYSTKLRKKLSARYEVFERLIDFAVWRAATSHALLPLGAGSRPVRGRSVRPAHGALAFLFLRSFAPQGPIVLMGGHFRPRNLARRQATIGETAGFEEIDTQSPALSKSWALEKGATDLRLARHFDEVRIGFRDYRVKPCGRTIRC